VDIDTTITYRYLEIFFLDKGHVTKMKKTYFSLSAFHLLALLADVRTDDA